MEPFSQPYETDDSYTVRAIKRVAAPPPHIFHRDYVRKYRPVVLTGLFDSTPLRAMDTLDAAARGLSAIPIEVAPSYIAAITSGTPIGPRTVSLGEYLAVIRGGSFVPRLARSFPLRPSCAP